MYTHTDLHCMGSSMPMNPPIQACASGRCLDNYLRANKSWGGPIPGRHTHTRTHPTLKPPANGPGTPSLSPHALLRPLVIRSYLEGKGYSSMGDDG